MNNHITQAIFDTDATGKKTVKTYVYSALFLLAVAFLMGVILLTPRQRNLPREISLQMAEGSDVQIAVGDGEILAVRIRQGAPPAGLPPAGFPPAGPQARAGASCKAAQMGCAGKAMDSAPEKNPRDNGKK